MRALRIKLLKIAYCFYYYYINKRVCSFMFKGFFSFSNACYGQVATFITLMMVGSFDKLQWRFLGFKLLITEHTNLIQVCVSLFLYLFFSFCSLEMGMRKVELI